MNVEINGAEISRMGTLLLAMERTRERKVDALRYSLVFLVAYLMPLHYDWHWDIAVPALFLACLFWPELEPRLIRLALRSGRKSKGLHLVRESADRAAIIRACGGCPNCGQEKHLRDDYEDGRVVGCYSCGKAWLVDDVAVYRLGAPS